MIEHPLIERKQETYSTHLGQQIFDLGEQTFVIPADFEYQVIEVTAGFIARPDLISQRLYSTSKYADLICKLNGISNPFELNEGMQLIVPVQQDLSKFYYHEDSAEQVSRITKRKKDKRKPNEAIQGDKRFKIDSTHKVVIY